MMDHQDNVNQQLAIIRDILLHGDREEIKKIKGIIDSRVEMETRIQPIIDENISHIKKNFPEVFGKEVSLEVEKKILLSNDLILTAISPLMGKMIKRYITIQFQELKESIDRSVKNNFSAKRYYHLLLSRVFGIKSSEIILSELDAFKPDIKDIFVIQRNSGLLMGSYSTTEMGDSGIFGGMLTAIKSFGEDVFKNSGDDGHELEMIEYNSFKIFMQSHHNYYFAVVLKGTYNSSEKDKLSNQLIAFAEKEKKLNLKDFTGDDVKYISDQLGKFFA